MLSDDCDDWPKDPFQLLGVAPPLTEQDLKRAYTRLIRRFKPEHHPEHFRRIREAYENGLQRLKWLNWYPVLDPSPPVEEPPASTTESTEKREPPPSIEPVTELPAPTSADKSHDTPVVADASREDRDAAKPHGHEPPRFETVEPKPPRTVAVDPVEEAWKLAVANRRAEAYEQLVTLVQSWPERPDLPLRLYWLLALNPELDPVRQRHDWLVLALKRSQLSGSAVELYTRELDTYPEAALAEPYDRLLELDAASTSLLSIAHQRLHAAGARRLWAVLDRDMQTLAERMGHLGETGWLTYLTAALGYAAFDRPAPLYERAREWLAGLKHLELREGWAFDQLEEKEHQAAVWRAAKQAPGPVREVVRDAWVAPGPAWKKSMGRAAMWAADDPAAALDQFDLAARTADCQPVIAAFQLLLDSCAPPEPREYPRGLIRGLVREFLIYYGRGDYRGIRPDLVRFLVREAIDPEELVAACSVASAFQSRVLVEHVQNDPVLRLVWRTAHAARG